MRIAAIFLSSFVAAALGVPLDHVLHEKRGLHHGLIKSRSTLEADSVIPVRIAVKQRNIDRAMDLLMEVSDPDSPKYGQHYTADEVARLFAPEDGSVDKITQWLVEAGINGNGITVPKSKGYVDFRTTVKQLESLVQAKYHVYQHDASGTEHFGTDSYHLPRDISNLVEFIAPGIATATVENKSGKPIPRPGRPRPVPYRGPHSLATNPDPSNCLYFVAPDCIMGLYNITSGVLHDPSNALGIFEYNDEMYLQSDLDRYFGDVATYIPKGTGPKINLIDWKQGEKPDPSHAEGEAVLDFDIAIPIIYPQSTELYQTKTNFNGDTHMIGLFNQWLDAIDGTYCTSSDQGETGDDPNVDGKTDNEMCGTFKPTNVISLSYGLTESLWPAAYLKRQCDEFTKLGLQGISIVFASGDGGVAGNHGGECLGKNGDIFNPASPGSCPAITSVGSTALPQDGSNVTSGEKATDRFASGGGFSNIWTMPSYQSAAVSKYFSTSDPGFASYTTKDGVIPTTGGIYNKAGRGFPDVAALGDNFAMYFNNETVVGGGTSMAAPIFASILTRINDERIAVGKKPVGFVNPALYKNPEMFHDITVGDQSGGNGQCKGKGFKAVQGWDPVSGLGRPKYSDMLQYFKGLP